MLVMPQESQDGGKMKENNEHHHAEDIEISINNPFPVD